MPCPGRHDQPYQIALYNLGVLCEAKRWHVADYEAVLPGITAEQLQVGWGVGSGEWGVSGPGWLGAGAVNAEAQQLGWPLLQRLS